MHNRKFLEKAAGVLGAVLVIISMLPWALEYVPLIAGFSCYKINGGSMEPGMHDGDLVYAKYVDYAGIHEGDVVIFRDWMDDNSYIIHRAVKILPDENMIVTKGDANAAHDALPVPYGNIMGRLALRIPCLGSIVASCTNGAGGCASLCLAGAGAMLLVMGWACRRPNRTV